MYLTPGDPALMRLSSQGTTITEEMLRFYNADMNFVSEKGEFTLWTGGSSLTKNSADFRLV